MKRVMIATALLLSACATPYDVPHPSFVEGKRAYTMSGWYQFSSDQKKAESWIKERLGYACQGSVELTYLKIEDVSRGPLFPSHLWYEAVGTCTEEANQEN